VGQQLGGSQKRIGGTDWKVSLPPLFFFFFPSSSPLPSSSSSSHLGGEDALNRLDPTDRHTDAESGEDEAAEAASWEQEPRDELQVSGIGRQARRQAGSQAEEEV
jgi:hypothetical protein